MKNILVVVDTPEDLTAVSQVIEYAGYKVIPTKNPNEALNIINSYNQIDLIISDIQLENQNGIEFKRELEKEIYSSQIPFIFLSGVFEYKYLREAMLYGANDFLLKPINNKELLEAVNNCFKKYEKIKLTIDEKIDETGVLLSPSFNNSNDYNLLIDKKYKIVGFNDTFREIVKKAYNTALTIGESVLNYQKIIAKEPLVENINRALKGEIISREIDLIYPNENRITLQVNYKPVFNKYGNIFAVIYTANNITANKQIERELKNLSEKMNLLAKTARIGIWEYQIESKIITWNEQMYDLFCVKNNLNVSLEDWCNLIDENYLKNFIELFSNNNFSYKELDLKIKNPCSIEYVKFALIKYENMVEERKILGICWDITSYMKLFSELNSAKEFAEKSDRLKTEFLAQMSHEIRTPINIILNYISLLKEEFFSKDSRINSFFLGIETSTKRIIRTIDLILNMSELQLGIYNPIYEKINIYDDVINDIVIEYGEYFHSKNNKIEIEGELSDCLVYCDRYSMIQIFSHLIDNANKYTNNGIIKIVICCDEHNQYISVIDSGIGIAEEFLEDIFTPFTQEDTGYTRKYEGNGLGLTLVKKYCDVNNAEISVVSKKNIGSNFTIRIPK
ncbi:MAG: response regulator [Melioribacteraceae bacterium]|nr:response regulator [Melioribacteraceae bacterium]